MHLLPSLPSACRSRACQGGSTSHATHLATPAPLFVTLPTHTHTHRFLSKRPTPTSSRTSPVSRASPPSSSSGADDVPTSSMSTEDAALVLGLPTSSSSSFDDILSRKNRLLAEAGADQARITQIEQAYDVMFMQSMRKRLTGEVSTTVRFADVGSTSRRGPGSSRTQANASSSKMPSFGAPKLPGGLGVAWPPPNQQVATQQAAIFTALGVWALIQAIAEPPVVQMGDTAGTQLSLALAYSVYTLKENKRMSIGKALGLSLAGLVFWALLGTAIQTWLRVDIVPLGSFQSPGVFCTEFVIVGLLLGALVLV